MFNRQSIHISFLLWGCVFCLLTAFCTHMGKDVDRKNKIHMISLQFTGAVLMCSDAFAWGFRGYPGNLGRNMVVISNFLVFTCSDLLLLFYHEYVCSCLFEKNPGEAKKYIRVKIVYGISIAAILLVVISQFAHFYYYVDAQNYYHRNYAHFVSLLLPMTGIVLDASLIIQFRNKISRELLTALLSYIVLPFVASIVLLFYYGISLNNIAITISIILMFLQNTVEQVKKVASQERRLASQELQLAGQERTLAKQERMLAKQERTLVCQEREIMDRRIASMMSQIRNHFIFNCLSTISGYCKIDPEKADAALTRFTRYLRRNMNFLEEKGLITFENEVKQLEDYVALEQMRFGDLIEFGEDFETVAFKIPPLTVQPLVENAIEHGLTKPGKKGSVCVLTRKEKSGIVIEVIDDGVGFETSEMEEKNSIGIRNVRYRLGHMINASLKIESTPGKGTRAVIFIPVTAEDENRR